MKMTFYLTLISLLLVLCNYQTKYVVSLKNNYVILEEVRHDSLRDISPFSTTYTIVLKKEDISTFNKVKIEAEDSVTLAFDGLNYFTYYDYYFYDDDVEYFNKEKWSKGNGIIKDYFHKPELVSEFHDIDSVKFFIRFGFSKEQMQTSVDSIKCKLQLFDEIGRDTAIIVKFNTKVVKW